MKKLLFVTLILFTLLISATLDAKPRSIGLNLNGIDYGVAYQHNISERDFIEANLGYAFFYTPGAQISATYNITFLPYEFDAGDLSGKMLLYGGAGLYTGIAYNSFGSIKTYRFSAGVLGQIGVEYAFDKFPITLSLSSHLPIGYSISNTNFLGKTITASSYDLDAYVRSLIPHLGIRYRF